VPLLLFVDKDELEFPAIACCILTAFSKEPAINNTTNTTDNTQAIIAITYM
jgi:hypothetical protein